jgi:cytosine/uracil/thiamine/allantoin permease
MKQRCFLLALLVFSTVAFTGCEVIGDIFKTGVWVGALLVIGIIGLIVWAVSKTGS